jgi:ankyrin repeat protein
MCSRACAGWPSPVCSPSLFPGRPSTAEQLHIVELSRTLQLPEHREEALLPRWRLLRHILGATDEQAHAVLMLEKRFWSHPIEKSLLPRHAYLMSRGLPHGARLLRFRRTGLRALLLEPKSDTQFASAVASLRRCRDSAADITADFDAFSRAFRRGALDAARSGDVGMLRLLHSHGWSACDERDRRNVSAMHYAAGHGHTECVAFLREAGISTDDRDADGATPLHWAVAGCRLLPMGRQANRSGTKRHVDGPPARHGFGTGGHLDTARWLVRHGADPRATTRDGNSIVHWCAWAGGEPMLRWLCFDLGLKAGVHALNAKGCSAAHWAASGGDLAVCRLLAEECGVGFSLPNHEGNTPLTKAIQHEREEVVLYLLQAGRCERGRGAADAAGYAARLSVRHSATEATHRISEMMQSYLLAMYPEQSSRGTRGGWGGAAGGERHIQHTEKEHMNPGPGQGSLSRPTNWPIGRCLVRRCNGATKGVGPGQIRTVLSRSARRA